MDSVKSEGERALPRDGTVHELTRNALIFTEQLLEYAPTLSPILQREASLTTAMATLTRGLDSALLARALLGAYVSEYSYCCGSRLLFFFMLKEVIELVAYYLYRSLIGIKTCSGGINVSLD